MIEKLTLRDPPAPPATERRYIRSLDFQMNAGQFIRKFYAGFSLSA